MCSITSDGVNSADTIGTTPHLPPELYEAIVDQVDELEEPFNTQCLKQCVLVCHVFVTRCQKHLFRRVELSRPLRVLRNNTISEFYPARHFLETIEGSPHLCKYVEQIAITDDKHTKSYEEEMSWIRRDEVVERILPMLDHLKGLSIVGDTSGNRLNFDAWRDELKAAIMLKCRSTSSPLAKIGLTWVRLVPLEIFNHMPALESMYLFRTVFRPDEELGTSTATSTKAALKSLEINALSFSEYGYILRWLRSPKCTLDITRLKRLALHLDLFTVGEGLSSVTQWLESIASVPRACAKTLQDLRLHCPYAVSSPSLFGKPFVDLGSMPSLRSVSLQMCICDPDYEVRDNVLWLANTLARIPKQHSLHTISLICTIKEFDGIATSGFKDVSWMVFVVIILQLAETASVDLSFSILEPGGYARALLEDRLAVLLERGIATIYESAD